MAVKIKKVAVKRSKFRFWRQSVPIVKTGGNGEVTFGNVFANKSDSGRRFRPQWISEGGPTITLSAIMLEKIAKNGSQKRKTQEVHIYFLCKNGRLWEVKVVLASHACCELGGLGVSWKSKENAHQNDTKTKKSIHVAFGLQFSRFLKF